MSKKELDDNEIIAKLLENKPAEVEIEVRLPSNGKLYKRKNPFVKIRPLNFEDEKAIALAMEAGEVTNETILLRCVDGLSPNELLPIDELFLTIKLREISHGKNVDLTYKCNNKKCRKDVTASLDLSQLHIEYLEEELKEPYEFELPTLKKKCRIRFIKASDDIYRSSDSVFLSNLWRFVISIEDYSKPEIIMEVIKNLPREDRSLLIDTISLAKYGVDPRAKIECPHCKKETVQAVPLTGNFF